MTDLLSSLVEPFRNFWMQFLQYLPKVFTFALFLIGGWIIARVARKIVIKTLNLLRIDVVAEKSGIEGFLLQGGVRFTAVTLLANLVYWFIMFAVTLAAFNALGLQVASDLFSRIVLYIPNVVVAVILLIFGTFFAKVIEGMIFTYLNNVGITGAQLISRIAQYAVLIFVVSLVFEQLSIGGQILISAFQIAFGALCLALALAFGLGGREWAAHLLEKLWKK